MENTRADKIEASLKIALGLFFVLVIAYSAIKFIPDVLVLLKNGDADSMQLYIKSAGSMGIGIIVLLQILQTVTIVFPGIPIYMCAGIIYGRKMGTLICYLTYVISNIVIFVFARRMGEAADVLLNNSDDKGIGNLLKKTKHPVRLVALLCVIPVIPNGIIPHIAAKSKLSLKQFALAVSVGCIPGIFLFVCCGEFILKGYLGPIIAICVLALVLLVVSYFFKDKVAELFDRILQRFSDKDTE